MDEVGEEEGREGGEEEERRRSEEKKKREEKWLFHLMFKIGPGGPSSGYESSLKTLCERTQNL